jgi:methionine biosynthesis protein MetW
MRYDLTVIASWIEPGSRVLDLGCGDGGLLSHLRQEKGVRATGVEMDEAKAKEGIARGLPVIHGDIYEEIEDYPDQAFDFVVLSQTLQQVTDPARLIRAMLRVGARGIVSFPNFGHLRHRLQFFFTGRAPVSPELPYQWHDTPNIRVISVNDFKRFCAQSGFHIQKEVDIRSHHHESQGQVVTFMPNLFSSYGIFLLGRREG